MTKDATDYWRNLAGTGRNRMPAAANSSAPGPKVPVISQTDPLISGTLADATLPGVMAELDPDAADEAGAFEETALTEEEAWEANADLGGDGEPTDG